MSDFIIKKFNTFEEIPDIFSVQTPFQTLWYQKVFAKHFCKLDDLILLGVYENIKCIGYVNFERNNNSILFLGMKLVFGKEELTDFGDMVLDDGYEKNRAEIWNHIYIWLKENSYKLLQLDYVREDSGTLSVFKNQIIFEQANSPFVDLKDQTWESYLKLLDRKARKELKRKIRRLETINNGFTYFQNISEENFDEFIRLLKLSNPEKALFMTDKMKEFFWDLITSDKKDWKVILSFLQIEGKNVATIFSFENNRSILGYNSGYDHGSNYYSVGLLIHALKIKQALENGIETYDFLRGEERYKFDLGAKKKSLFKISISL